MFFVFHLFYKIAISYSARCVTEASDKIIYSSLWDQWWWRCNSRYEKKQQEGMFSWTKRLVRQVVQRILDTVLWPSPVTAHWVAGWQNLCQTWEWTFSAPWDEMVMKCPPQSRGQVYEQKGALPTEDWQWLYNLQWLYHGHCNCWLSTALKEVQGEDQEWGVPCSGKNWQNRPSDS